LVLFLSDPKRDKAWTDFLQQSWPPPSPLKAFRRRMRGVHAKGDLSADADARTMRLADRLGRHAPVSGAWRWSGFRDLQAEACYFYAALAKSLSPAWRSA
jgi:hypothetical protein